MSDQVYQVRDWDHNFEGAKSKTYNNKTSCTMPTKHGLGYKRVIRHEDGAAIFGAWCAMIQILSRHPKKRQGYCTDTGLQDGRPYTADDLECLTDIPSKYFTAMFDVCTSEVVQWMVVIDAEKPQGYHEDSNYPLNSDLDSNLNLDSDSNSDSTRSAREFEQFWNAYPNKDAKQSAMVAWCHSEERPCIKIILEAVKEQANSDKWQEENGRFIPKPENWLKGGCWDNVVPAKEGEFKSRFGEA